jgi:hypothetical protein
VVNRSILAKKLPELRFSVLALACLAMQPAALAAPAAKRGVSRPAAPAASRSAPATASVSRARQGASPRVVRGNTPAPASYQASPTARGRTVITSQDPSPQTKPETTLLGKGSLAAKSIQDQYRQTRLASFGFGVDLTHQVLPGTMEAHIDAGALLQTGSSQALFFDEYAPYQGIYVSEAVIRWTPVSVFMLTAGGVDQGRYDAPTLLDSRAFPGAVETLRVPMGQAYFALEAEQAIPTSSTLSTKAGDEIGTPMLFIEQAKLGFERGKQFSLEGSVGYFQLMNLPRSVAHESRFMGNSVEGVANTGAKYLYKYEGLLTGGKMGLAFNRRARWDLTGSFVYNRHAPAGQNSGLHVGNAVEFVVSDKVRLTPKLDLFRNEKDSAPGYYNSAGLGHNNRVGFGGALMLELPRERFSVEGRFVQSSLLEPSPFQAGLQLITITLRKSYVLL